MVYAEKIKAAAAPLFASTIAPSADRPLRIKEGRVLVTPELAQRILAECAYEKQRGVRPHHVRRLANAMHRKRWTDGTQLHLALLDGRYFLVDGQHRLNAVVQAQTEIEFSLLVTECDSAEEVAQLYARHDTMAQARSMLDCIRPMAVSAEVEMCETDVVKTLTAVCSIKLGFKEPRGNPAAADLSSPEVRLEAASGWWDAARQYLSAIAGADRAVRRALVRSSVMAVAMMTFKYQPAVAEDFWGALARDDGLRKNDPRKTLNKYLLERSIGTNARSVEMVRAAATAWNAFFGQRSLEVIRVSPEKPVVIDGTPVGKRRKAA